MPWTDRIRTALTEWRIRRRLDSLRAPLALAWLSVEIEILEAAWPTIRP